MLGRQPGEGEKASRDFSQFKRKLGNILFGQRGYTLVELLVATTIIAILCGLATRGLLRHTERARVSRAVTDLACMRNAVQVYAVTEGRGRYPGADSFGLGGVAKVLQAAGIKWTGDADGIRDPWGSPYQYGHGCG